MISHLISPPEGGSVGRKVAEKNYSHRYEILTLKNSEQLLPEDKPF